MTALPTKHGETNGGGNSDIEADENDDELVMEGKDQTIDIAAEETGKITANKFCIDYSKRGIAKCKVCKKCIQKGELRIGIYAQFKDRRIVNYFHVPCSFEKMRLARDATNAMKSN